jgi:hypothetical protein
MRYFVTTALLSLLGCQPAPSEQTASPAFGAPRVFAGKWEGHWEYTAFRECGTPENCVNAVADCGVDVAQSARADWRRLKPNPSAHYWVEFIGRSRAASPAETADNLDSQECAVEIQRLLRACQSFSPIYPNAQEQRPLCASLRSR